MLFKKTFEAGLAALGIALSSGAKAEEPKKPEITHVEHAAGQDILVDEDGLIAETKGPDSAHPIYGGETIVRTVESPNLSVRERPDQTLAKQSALRAEIEALYEKEKEGLPGAPTELPTMAEQERLEKEKKAKGKMAMK